MIWFAAVLLCYAALLDGAAIEEAPSSTKVTATSASPALHDPCAKCLRLANRAKQWYSDYHWFRVNDRDEVPNPYREAGLKSCEEFRWAYQCFQHCAAELAEGQIYSYPPTYKQLGQIIDKYCEETWTDGKSCRMADARACDMKYNKRLCGDHLEKYSACVDDVLARSKQDCGGVCTPARRFHKINIFEWEVECRLKRADTSWCLDYTQLYCFDALKDTELSWGIFENLNKNESTLNLEEFCPVLHNVSNCLMSTIKTEVLYFGFPVNKPCSWVEQDVFELIDKWESIIHPLCAGRENGTTTVQEICGVAPTTMRMPSTTSTTPAPTTLNEEVEFEIVTDSSQELRILADMIRGVGSVSDLVQEFGDMSNSSADVENVTKTEST